MVYLSGIDYRNAGFQASDVRETVYKLETSKNDVQLLCNIYYNLLNTFR